MSDFIKAIDARCIPLMVGHSPVTFGFGGTDYTGTLGARSTMLELVEGGHHDDQEFTILVAVAQYGASARPQEKDLLTVCVDTDGIPSSADDAVGSRVNARIQTIVRAGAGLTYTLRNAGRG